MVNSSSNFATDAFGDTIVLCIGCGCYTANLAEEVCEVCEESGLSRDLILMEQEFFSSDEDDNSLDDLEARHAYEDSMDEFADVDDFPYYVWDDCRLDYYDSW